MSGQLLVVEDEPDLSGPLAFFLESRGFKVVIAATGHEALRLATTTAPDLILLDLMLPDLSGLEVCRRLRADPATMSLPILIATARADEYDKLVGFEAGADDYVTKPYSLRELGARVQALLRRIERAAPPDDDLVRFGDLVVDGRAHVASYAGQVLPLTLIEFRMLCAFLAHRGEALDREALCLITWGERYAISERAVDTNVKRLRRKLGEAGRWVETVRGLGYRWSAHPSLIRRLDDDEPA